MRKCDNWRGIALLDVVGKLNVRIIQERLQTLAEEELLESQRRVVDVHMDFTIKTAGRKVEA